MCVIVPLLPVLEEGDPVSDVETEGALDAAVDALPRAVVLVPSVKLPIGEGLGTGVPEQELEGLLKTSRGVEDDVWLPVCELLPLPVPVAVRVALAGHERVAVWLREGVLARVTVGALLLVALAEAHTGGNITARYACLVCRLPSSTDVLVFVLSLQSCEKSRSGAETA